MARMVCAMPDIDGEYDPARNQLRFHRLPVPNDLDALPPRPGPLTIVIVFDLTGTECPSSPPCDLAERADCASKPP
jgi:hypothetical protein